MSTAIVIALDYHSAAIVDGESMTVNIMKMLLCNVLLTTASEWSLSSSSTELECIVKF